MEVVAIVLEYHLPAHREGMGEAYTIVLRVKHENLKCMGIMQDNPCHPYMGIMQDNPCHPYILSTTVLRDMESRLQPILEWKFNFLYSRTIHVQMYLHK